MNRRKNGYTLIEIIVVVALISAISTAGLFGIRKIAKYNATKEFNKITKNFASALQVYLMNHREVEENLMLNSKAAIITLETLKNDGLIDDNITNPLTKEKFDYSSNYFTLLEAKVVDKSELTEEEKNCENNVLGINILNSWDLKNLKTSDVIYVCPRKDYSNDIESMKEAIDELASKLDSIKSEGTHTEGENTKDKLKLDSLYNDLTYTAKGVNPNNYVRFGVYSHTSDFAYFPNTENKGLWRIISINSSNEIELIYTEPVLSNNDKYASSTLCTTITDNKSTGVKEYKYCELLYSLPHLYSSNKYRYDTTNGWIAEEVAAAPDVDSDTNISKKIDLYDSIVNKKWIIKKKYYPYYSVDSNHIASLNLSNSIETKIGVLNYNQVKSSIDISESWLNNYNTIMGLANTSWEKYLDPYYVISNINGNISMSKRYSQVSITNSNGSEVNYHISALLNLTTGNYYPVITLSSKVDLVEPTCSDGKIKGSKQCPYTLSCDNC